LNCVLPESFKASVRSPALREQRGLDQRDDRHDRDRAADRDRDVGHRLGRISPASAAASRAMRGRRRRTPPHRRRSGDLYRYYGIDATAIAAAAAALTPGRPIRYLRALSVIRKGRVRGAAPFSSQLAEKARFSLALSRQTLDG
jgi:hypothetical protein